MSPRIRRKRENKKYKKYYVKALKHIENGEIIFLPVGYITIWDEDDSGILNLNMFPDSKFRIYFDSVGS